MSRKKWNRTFSFKQFEKAAEAQAGLCVECGAWHDCVEPDARKYYCEECGAKTVYGAENLLLMGLIREEPRPRITMAD
jgi:hypothetical protein